MLAKGDKTRLTVASGRVYIMLFFVDFYPLLCPRIPCKIFGGKVSRRWATKGSSK